MDLEPFYATWLFGLFLSQSLNFAYIILKIAHTLSFLIQLSAELKMPQHSFLV